MILKIVKNDMKENDSSMIFYNTINDLLGSDDFLGAIKYIEINIDKIDDCENICLAYLILGYLNNDLGKDNLAVDNFSKAIFYQEKLSFSCKISNDISYSGRSNSRYKIGDFKGALYDKKKARAVRLLEAEKFLSDDHPELDYRKISLGLCDDSNLHPKYMSLIKVAKIKKNKYDLIEDYKKVIPPERKNEVIEKLEDLSILKYKEGDFKASIRAIRRAEKYY